MSAKCAVALICWFALAGGVFGAPSDANLRTKGISELRVMVKELSLINDSTEAKLQVAENQLIATKGENVKLATDVANLRQWGINQYNRADQAEKKYWDEAAAHKRTAARLHIWHIVGSITLGGLAFVFVLQATKNAWSPWVQFGPPIAAALAVAGAVFLFL